jgi:uncharacterized protein (TIGR03435 family)
MSLMVMLLALVAGFSSARPNLLAQVPAATTPPLEFDVASVKQNKSDRDSSSNLSLDSGNLYSAVSHDDVSAPAENYFSATNQPLWQYIVFAYKLSGTEEMTLRFSYFSGLSSKAPSWATGGFDVSADRFDIQARAPGHPTKDQMRLMMQSLLADRFHLVVHRETRVVPVFALVLVAEEKTGPRLEPHAASDSCTLLSPDSKAGGLQPAASRTSVVGTLPIVCGVIAHVPGNVAALAHGPEPTRGWHYGGRGVPLTLLATSLPTMTGMATIPRPVVDRTRLTGTYDFTLEWTPENEEAGHEGDVSGSNFRDALKDQLGLKLVSEKGPVDILVIDHIEHPTRKLRCQLRRERDWGWVGPVAAARGDLDAGVVGYA